MTTLESILNEGKFTPPQEKPPTPQEKSPAPQEKSPTSKDNPPKTRAELDGGSKWGYDLYPERRGQKETGLKGFMKGRENVEKIKCERTVYKCVQTSPLVRLMMGALKRSGCEVDIRRHIACEECSPTVSGGYDPVLNQIIVCHNVATSEGIVQGILTHEMIHMFDYCRNDLNFKNIDHLACTEIRAANLTHCSFATAWNQGDASLFNFKEAHQNCVKTKALQSILAVRDVTKLEAINAVERVFPKCYADLEPIGRRIRRNSADMYKAYNEGYLFGYD